MEITQESVHSRHRRRRLTTVLVCVHRHNRSVAITTGEQFACFLVLTVLTTHECDRRTDGRTGRRRFGV